MQIGLDIGRFFLSPRTGIGRCMAALAEQLPRVDPAIQLRIFADRLPDDVTEDERALLESLFPGREVMRRSGRVPILRPSEFRKTRRLGLSRLLKPLNPLFMGLTSRINEGRSAWTRGILRRRCPPGPEEVDLMHLLRHYVSYPWRRRRNVVTIHDIIPLTHPEFTPPEIVHRMRLLLEFARTSSEAIIADSEFTRGELIERCTLPPDRVFAIYNGISPAFHPRDIVQQQAARAALGVGSDEPFALFVGTLDRRKNLDALLKASERVMSSVPHRLVMVGLNPYGPDPNLDQAGVVHWRELDEETLAGLMSAATALAQPSFAEGFGLPVLEAMACGCPVIASDTTSLPEVAGGAALLFDPHDTDALAERLRAVLRNELLRRQLRAKGLARAAQFSWERAARETVAVYRHVA